MTHKQLEKKINVYKDKLYPDNKSKEFKVIYIFEKDELLGLIREVVESVIPDRFILNAGGIGSYESGWNNSTKEMKDNLDKLLK